MTPTPTTIRQALEQQMDIFMFHRDTKVLELPVAVAMRAIGRETVAFDEVIGESMQTVMAVLAVSKRPSSGTAGEVKKHRR